MKKQLAVSAVLIVLLGALPQARRAQVPWPGDDRKLGFFVGSWSVEAEIKAGNGYGAPVGRYTFTEKYGWRPGEFLLKTTRDDRPPGGSAWHDYTFGYFITTRKYSVIGRHPITGVLVSGDGINEGDTWTFATVGYLGNLKYVYERCTLNVTSRDAYTMKCDTSPDKATWTSAFEAKATRR